jgi:hypothetical protein
MMKWSSLSSTCFTQNLNPEKELTMQEMGRVLARMLVDGASMTKAFAQKSSRWQTNCLRLKTKLQSCATSMLHFLKSATNRERPTAPTINKRGFFDKECVKLKEGVRKLDKN